MGVHGHESKSQTYRVYGLWCIHWYDYAGEIQIGDWAGEIRPGAVSLVPPGRLLVHRWRHEDSRHYFAHFSLPVRKGGMRMVPAWVWPPEDCLASLMEVVGTEYVSNLARATSALWECLWKIAEAKSMGVSAGPIGLVEEIKRYIERSLAQPISLEAVARHFKLSVNHVNRIFSRATGVTICSYWRKRRVESACRLLRHTSMTVKEVAIQCGYSDLQQFNKLMRLLAGVPPREIRAVRRR